MGLLQVSELSRSRHQIIISPYPWSLRLVRTMIYVKPGLWTLYITSLIDTFSRLWAISITSSCYYSTLSLELTASSKEEWLLARLHITLKDDDWKCNHTNGSLPRRTSFFNIGPPNYFVCRSTLLLLFLLLLLSLPMIGVLRFCSVIRLLISPLNPPQGPPSTHH